MVSIRKLAILTAISGLIIIGFATFTMVPYRIALLLLLSAGALYVMSHSKLRGFSFTAWVLVCVGLALAYPQYLHEWGDFRLSLLIVPLTQLIMFGMGTTLSLKDFSGILVAGLLSHSILYSPRPWAGGTGPLSVIALTSAAVVGVALALTPEMLGVIAPLRNGLILGGALLTAVAISKLIVSVCIILYMGSPYRPCEPEVILSPDGTYEDLVLFSSLGFQ